MKIELTQRRAYVADRGFVFDAYKTALRNYVDWAWGWDEEFQRSGFFRHHPIEQLRIVQVNGRSAGALHVEQLDACHFLRLIFLLPQYQGQGIGRRLVGAEIEGARYRGRQLQLRVIKINPAKRLYERLGLEVTGEDGATYLMCSA